MTRFVQRSQKFVKKEDGPPVFAHDEELLAEALGVTRERLRNVRTELLTEGKDWAMVDRRVMLCSKAAEAVTRALESKDAALAGEDGCVHPEDVQKALEKSDREKNAPAEATLVIRRITRNTQYVYCLLEGVEQAVRVGNAELFLPGMSIPARHVKGWLWELVGRMPRAKGRW
jgi:hypothetical protein